MFFYYRTVNLMVMDRNGIFFTLCKEVCLGPWTPNFRTWTTKRWKSISLVSTKMISVTPSVSPTRNSCWHQIWESPSTCKGTKDRHFRREPTWFIKDQGYRKEETVVFMQCGLYAPFALYLGLTCRRKLKPKFFPVGTENWDSFYVKWVDQKKKRSYHVLNIQRPLDWVV